MELEAIIFVRAWATVVPLAVALVCQVAIAWRTLPNPAPPRPKRSIDWPSLSFQPSAAVAQVESRCGKPIVLAVSDEEDGSEVDAGEKEVKVDQHVV